MSHISIAGPEEPLLGWTWSVRGNEKPSVSHQSSWVDGETINRAGKGQGRKRARDLPEAETESKEAPPPTLRGCLHHSKWGALHSETSWTPQMLDAIMMSEGTGDMGDQLIPGHEPLEHGGAWQRGGQEPWAFKDD